MITEETLRMLEKEASQFLTTRPMKVTPELAQYWLSFNSYDNQRDLKRKKMTDFSSTMNEGKWANGVSTIIFAVLKNDNDKHVLVDGQHRLNAICKSGKSQIMSIAYVNVFSDKEVAYTYFKIDRGIKRSTFEALKATNTPEQMGLTDNQTRQTAAAIKFLFKGFKRFPLQKIDRDDEEVLEIIKYYSQAIEDFWEIQSRIPNSITVAKRMSVSSVGIALFQEASITYGKARVEEFVHSILSGDMLEKNDPRFIAYNHLITTNLNHAKPGEKLVTAEQQARYLIYCWNFWVKGKELKSVSRGKMDEMNDTTHLVHIEGTRSWK